MTLVDQVKSALYSPTFTGRLTEHGIFIGSNSSALNLESAGASALPAIESVLLEEQKSIDYCALVDRIGSILNSYFSITHECGYGGARDFVLRLEQPLRAIALAEICCVWGSSGGLNRLRPVPAWLRELLDLLECNEEYAAIVQRIRDCIIRQ